MKQTLWEKLESLYSDGIPEYITSVNTQSIKINICDWSGNKVVTVKVKDVIIYYAYEARSMSGCRTLGNHSGDWRPIDELAKECLEIFKITNPFGLKKWAKKYGLTPKF